MIGSLRRAQAGWTAEPVSSRLAVVRRFRKLLAREAGSVAAATARPAMGRAEVMLAEIVPLLAACRFLERRAETLLAPRRARRRPLWLTGTRLRIERAPLGCVLILAPGNYPLLLPAVQALQALAAGNTVAVKPAPGGSAAMRAFADLLARAGLPDHALNVLDDTREAGDVALAQPFDHVVLTGSARTGRAVLASLAPRLIPATMELSGSDPLVVLRGGDVAVAAAAITYGLTLNGGATCIAPRRVVVLREVRAALVAALRARLPDAPSQAIPAAQGALVRGLLVEAGGDALGDTDALGGDAMRPLVLCDAPPATVATPDVFAPVAFLLEAVDEDHAVALANDSAYALGASVFGAPVEAARVARRLRAGCVTINDVIVPTADPNVPFGGAGESGFGTTRGAEGLLAMTRPRATLTRRRPTARHLRPVSDGASLWLGRALRLLYG